MARSIDDIIAEQEIKIHWLDKAQAIYHATEAIACLCTLWQRESPGFQWIYAIATARIDECLQCAKCATDNIGTKPDNTGIADTAAMIVQKCEPDGKEFYARDVFVEIGMVIDRDREVITDKYEQDMLDADAKQGEIQL